VPVLKTVSYLADQRRPPSRRENPNPKAKPVPADPARLAAFRLLRAVDADGAYANLVLPRLLGDLKLTGRDAALATELGYGTVRSSGVLDEILAACVDRAWPDVQAEIRDLLRLGAYQLLRTRIPPHAAVSVTLDLARAAGYDRAVGFLNAVLRRVSRSTWAQWIERLGAERSDLDRLALATAHPNWIARAFADALDDDAANGWTETEAALVADDVRPQTHLVAWPGASTTEELIEAGGGAAGPYSRYAVRLDGGDPAATAAVRERRAGVQDEGSQLCALALAGVAIDGADEHWLDLCAGPGGKAALLAALADERGVTLTANEVRPHRAELVRHVTDRWQFEGSEFDGRDFPPRDGGYDRILLDAPCSGLGALRRRPESRWRRQPSDVAELAELQRALLDAAIELLRPGGVVAYVTCSPHRAETIDVVAGRNLVDVRPAFAGVDDLGDGPWVQLWPHRHGTDAMFCALIRR
jgi:16S rRNA (cytosine967-C5)-methyltransferase